MKRGGERRGRRLLQAAIGLLWVVTAEAGAQPKQEAGFRPAWALPDRALLPVEVVETGEGYSFREGGTRLLTENAFIRRFRLLTESPELDAYERDRDSGWSRAFRIELLSSLGITAGLWTTSRLLRSQRVWDDRLRMIEMGAIVSSVTSAVLVAIWLATFDAQDGNVTQHSLRKDQATALATRFNDALRAPRRAGPETYRFVVDTALSRRAWTTNALTLSRAAIRAADFGGGQLRPSDGGALSLRLAQVLLVDLAVASYSVMAAHELLGHGSRAGEIDRRVESYRISLPLPYAFLFGGPSGFDGFTKWEDLYPDEPVQEATLLLGGGLEIEAFYRRSLSIEAARSGRLRHGDAMLYLATVLHLGAMTVGSNNDLTRHLEWVRQLDPQGGSWVDPYAKASMALSLIDPLLAFALYAELVQYPLRGATGFSLPAFGFGPWKWLPTHRAYVLPWGYEHALGLLAFQENGLVLDAELRAGGSGLGGSGGLSARLEGLQVSPSIFLRGGLDASIQPSLRGPRWTGDGKPNPVVAAEVGVDYHLGPWLLGVGARAKTFGVVELEPLAAGWAVEASLGFRLGN